MKNNTGKFFIGFDRYVQLNWCELTLEAATESSTSDDVKDEIATVLTGAESRRKTFDILKRLWLHPLPEYADFFKRGIELFRKSRESLTSALNWGCALVTYPFFGKTAEITGRLLAIQGDCSIKEVQRRMAEIYGDRDGVARAVSRVLQSQENWGMIERVEQGKRLVRKAPATISDEQAVTWLVEAAIRFTGKALAVQSIQSMAVLYPFVLDHPLAYAVSVSKNLELRSEGLNAHYVALRN